MFLGNRRIAWEVLKLLTSEPYRSWFDIQTLVTDHSIWRQYQQIYPDHTANFITNSERCYSEIRESIKSRSIGVLLSIQYNWIIPSDILQLVNYHAFNLHNAQLPNYKGYNSISHAIANGDATYLSTIHWMIETVDSGDIAYTVETPIHAEDTAESLYLRTINSAVVAVKKLLESLAKGVTPTRIKLSQNDGKFYSKNSVRIMEDVTEKLDAKNLAQIARAVYFPPFNAAYFIFQGRKYFLFPEDEARKILSRSNAPNELLC